MPHQLDFTRCLFIAFRPAQSVRFIFVHFALLGVFRGVRLVAVDLDLTLWDHPDISSTSPPFERVGRDSIVDSEDSLITLRPCAREFLVEAKRRDLRLAVVSWNVREKAEAALVELDLLDLFDFVVIELHPRKDEMFEKLLRSSGARAEEILYLDDNSAMIEKVKRRFPEVKAYLFGAEVDSFCRLIEELLSLSRQQSL